MKRAQIAIVAGALLAGAACSSAPSGAPLPPRPAPSASTAPLPAPGATWATAKLVTVRSLAHGFTMPLPEDPGWTVTDPPEGWFTARHAASSTQIAARMIATDGLANRARCERRARDLAALPEREGASILDRRRVDLPDGFDTVLEVGLAPSAPGQPISGFLLAIGGWARRCFVYALTTTATGPGAEEEVGDRLAFFVERSFSNLGFESALTPVVPREKPPVGP